MRYPFKITLSLAAALVAACTPLKVYYKEGAQVSRMDSDLTNCNVSALAEVPKDIRTRYIPPSYTPLPFCYGQGGCFWQDQITSPGRYVEYDANEDLRTQVSGQCMAQHGYTLVELPACDSAITHSVPLRATQIMPPLGPKSCAIRLKSGRWQVVTPAV